MSKYIIMHGSQWHETFDDFEEADNYYWEMIDEEGDWFDITLCRVIEHHEAAQTLDIKPHPHWHVDYSIRNIDVSKSEIVDMDTKNLSDTVYNPWFNRGKY